MKPILQALLLADRVYKEISGKHIIAGTFNRLQFQKNEPKVAVVDGRKTQVVPGGAQAGSPYAYISLTEVRGRVECNLRYTNLKQDKPLLECTFSVECEDPLITLELVFPLPPLPMVAGAHALELLCDGHLLGSHRIYVEEIEPQEPEDDSDTTED